MKILWTAVVLIFSISVFAKDIVELPQEELAKESVLPIFDRPVVVKSRRVVTDGKFDLNLFGGLALSEPIFNVTRYGISGYYNTSENNAFGILYVKNSSGLSTYAKQLNTQFGLDFSRSPSPNYAIFADWNLKLFYGKLSISKTATVNTTFFTSIGLGQIQYTHKSYPAAAFGFGEKFYFGSSFAIRFDMRLTASQAPVPFYDSTATPGVGLRTSQTAPDPGAFSERMTYTTVLDLGLSYLF